MATEVITQSPDLSGAFSTLVVLGNGCLSSALLCMDHNWNARGWQAVDDDEPEDLGALAMSCAFSTGNEVIYLFGSLSREPESVATALPPQVSDLLIFCPLVPLRKTTNGFQGLTPQEWSAIVVPVSVVPDQPTILSSFAPKEDYDDIDEDSLLDSDESGAREDCWSDVDDSGDEENIQLVAPSGSNLQPAEEDDCEGSEAEEDEVVSDDFSMDEYENE